MTRKIVSSTTIKTTSRGTTIRAKGAAAQSLFEAMCARHADDVKPVAPASPKK